MKDNNNPTKQQQNDAIDGLVWFKAFQRGVETLDVVADGTRAGRAGKRGSIKTVLRIDGMKAGEAYEYLTSPDVKAALDKAADEAGVDISKL